MLVLTILSACFTSHANTLSKAPSVVCHLHNHCTFTILNSHSITLIRLPPWSPSQHTDCHIHLNFWSRQKKPEARILVEPHTHIPPYKLSFIGNPASPLHLQQPLDTGFAKQQSSSIPAWKLNVWLINSAKCSDPLSGAMALQVKGQRPCPGVPCHSHPATFSSCATRQEQWQLQRIISSAQFFGEAYV